MKVYFISGLAADERVFRHIQLPDHYKAIHLNWLPPLPNESLPAYAVRLSEKIDTGEKFCLIGLSFGGMIAVEIARRLRPEKLILISSIPCPDHLPSYYKLVGVLRLHRLVPMRLIRTASIFKRNFTSETSEDKLMLSSMIRESDPAFIRWALHAILTWKCPDPPSGIIHLHGTNDGILPLRFTKPTHLIKKGTHLMVLTRAREINVILKELLAG